MQIRSTSIVVRTRFEGFHNYPEAPAGVEFLRDRHRHEFHVEAKIEVTHADRELEFILVKRFIESALPRAELGSKSCEMIAMELGQQIANRYGERWMTISVFEDGENGAVVVLEP